MVIFTFYEFTSYACQTFIGPPFRFTKLAVYPEKNKKKRKLLESEGESLKELIEMDENGYICSNEDSGIITIRMQSGTNSRNGAEPVDIIRLACNMLRKQKSTSRADSQLFTYIEDALHHCEQDKYEKFIGEKR